ncbi:hypothetical protein [Micromonospora sp. NPDC023888]|uniref:hypothetical protein n=1 Tax=Micromonospora sp. NPDC023888 TaxID=3155607 RepID=UPI0033D72857
MSGPATTGGGQPRASWSWAGRTLLIVGVLLVVVAFWLPAWRSVYPGRTDVTPGKEVIVGALPFAVVAAVFAVLSLANAGPSRWVWRQASLGMLVSNVLACGSLTGAFWYFEVNDPYVEEELLGSGPGVGILLALLGCLLIPLAGSLPNGRKGADRADRAT